MVESLCSNFAVLNPSITAISYASGESSEDAAYMLQQMQSHRNALKIYSYFLHSILVVEEAAEVEPSTKAPSGKVCINYFLNDFSLLYKASTKQVSLSGLKATKSRCISKYQVRWYGRIHLLLRFTIWS